MIAPWLTLPEFIAASTWSRANVYRLQSEGKIDTRKDGRVTLYSSASLPAEVLAKLAAPSQPRKELLRPAQPALAAAPLFASAVSGPGRRIVLDAEQERQAFDRLGILQPLLDFCGDREARARFGVLRLRDGSPIRNSEDMAAYLCQAHSTADRQITRSTLWRWKKEYEERGLDGLARKTRADKGTSKWAARWPEAAKLVAVTYLQPFRSKQSAYDALVRDRAMLGMPESELPSYASVCDFLASLPAAPTVLAREGDRAHHGRMMPYLQRAYTDVEPNQVWVADTMIHDALVRNDCFGACGNEAVRLQLTALMDLRSRKIVGYTWILDGSSRSITTALTMAVRRYGPCATFYCDNGKDFRKVDCVSKSNCALPRACAPPSIRSRARKHSDGQLHQPCRLQAPAGPLPPVGAPLA